MFRSDSRCDAFMRASVNANVMFGWGIRIEQLVERIAIARTESGYWLIRDTVNCEYGVCDSTDGTIDAIGIVDDAGSADIRTIHTGSNQAPGSIVIGGIIDAIVGNIGCACRGCCSTRSKAA